MKTDLEKMFKYPDLINAGVVEGTIMCTVEFTVWHDKQMQTFKVEGHDRQAVFARALQLFNFIVGDTVV